jgi:hypothetical protein
MVIRETRAQRPIPVQGAEAQEARPASARATGVLPKEPEAPAPSAEQRALLGHTLATEDFAGLQPTPREREWVTARIDTHVAAALEALGAGTSKKGLAARRLAEHAQTSAAAFGVRGAVAPASPAQLEAARAEGLALADGEIALAVGGGRGGAAVVAFAPHALFEPIVLNRSDGAREADFVARREVTPARGYVIAEPAEPFAKLKSWEGRALQAAGLVFVDADVTARRARHAAFGAQIEGYAAALARAELAPPARLQASATLATLRSLHETTGGMLEG